jgi:hypothetical protein
MTTRFSRRHLLTDLLPGLLGLFGLRKWCQVTLSPSPASPKAESQGVTYSLNYITSYNYDATMTEAWSTNLTRTTTVYDAAGNMLFVQHPNGTISQARGRSLDQC